MITLLLGKDLSTETGELSDIIILLFLTFKTRVYVLSTPSPLVRSGLFPENIAV